MAESDTPETLSLTIAGRVCLEDFREGPQRSGNQDGTACRFTGTGNGTLQSGVMTGLEGFHRQAERSFCLQYDFCGLLQILREGSGAAPEGKRMADTGKT